MQGNILYQFPSQQSTAASERNGRKKCVQGIWPESVGKVDKFFKEEKWQFRSLFYLQFPIMP